MKLQISTSFNEWHYQLNMIENLTVIFYNKKKLGGWYLESKVSKTHQSAWEISDIISCSSKWNS